MRKTFYELLESKEFNVSEEYEKLWFLFNEERRVVLNRYLNTISAYIDDKYFRELPFRGTATTLNELIEDINLPEYTEHLDDLYLLCEFLTAVLPPEKTNRNQDLLNQANTIRSNISYILEQTNHALKEDKNGNLIVVSKNQSAVLAAEIVKDDEVSFDLIEYNHYALRGNLSEKKKILSSIGLYIEPLLNNRELKNTVYKDLLSDTRFVFNNLHIRHNNLTGPKAQDYTQTLKDDELEKWYDKAYDLAIAVIITAECLPVQNEIGELKKNYKWKT